ncbi:hypothetical protein BH11BAC6_BH11BAC6_09380 [soil metagenome]
MKFNMGIMSTWEMNWNTGTDKIELDLNLVALFFIIFIDRLKNTVSTDNKVSINDDELELSKISK